MPSCSPRHHQLVIREPRCILDQRDNRAVLGEPMSQPLRDACRRSAGRLARGLPIGVALLLVPTLPGLANDLVVRDVHGRRIETIERGAGGDLVRRDREGRRIGTVEPGMGGERILRDRVGGRVGTVEEGAGGDLIIRDREGRRSYSIEPGVGGQRIIRDTQGRRLGTVEPR